MSTRRIIALAGLALSLLLATICAYVLSPLYGAGYLLACIAAGWLWRHALLATRRNRYAAMLRDTERLERELGIGGSRQHQGITPGQWATELSRIAESGVVTREEYDRISAYIHHAPTTHAALALPTEPVSPGATYWLSGPDGIWRATAGTDGRLGPWELQP